MKSPADSQLLLIGLPSAGKTSFLAALWYMVSQESVHCGLTLESLEGDSKYLNVIRDAWAKYKPVPRNQAELLNKVSMLLRNQVTGETTRLRFPDLSGEAFRVQWTDRELSEEYDKSLREATGGVLFVSSEGVRKPHRVDTVNDVLAGIGGDGGKPTADVTLTPWNKEDAPTQVQLVDVLQFMTNREYFEPPFRLAIVISAWDRVKPDNLRPGEWLSRELPLLKQFLDSHDESFDVSYWGVSAQGGQYALPHFCEDNFINCQEFAARLHGREDAVSAWIWEQLDAAARLALESARGGTALGDSDRKLLSRELNRLIGERALYEEARFAGVTMRSETVELQRNSERLQEGDVIYFGRLLMEDAYPELSRDRRNAQEAAALQGKRPGIRILLVGDHVVAPHDITEPIQWLMR